MKSPVSPVGRRRAHRPGDTGAALILALACVVILTGLVLAVLGHSLLETQVSTASAGQTQATLFARGAVDAVIGELKQEITAGSVSTFPPGTSDARDPNCFFLPAANQTMVPYRMDPAAPVNVLKRSAYNVPFYSGTVYNANWPLPSWASNLSSTNTATSGRAISISRWNKPLLIPTKDPSSTDTTPVSTFIPPDWIYMTRSAGPITSLDLTKLSNASSNPSYVVGRYAYVVYDEGGLLDVNAAGYPSSVTAAMVRHKISEACADLTQLTDSSGNQLLTTANIDALVAWRNPVNSASATAYTNYLYSAATNAFLTPAAGERLFTSRQQLIAFLTQNLANGDSTAIARMQGVLPLLTHFSRELNAPSWYPQNNQGNGYDYYNLSTNSLVATNVFVPLARAGSSYTNYSNLVIQPKQSVAFSRFPLSRLSWITLDGTPPVGVTAAKIQQSFGLVWDSANYAWKYVGPIGNAVLTQVANLRQITGREPNFFELLKAGILSGSVNLLPQPITSSFPSPGDMDSRYATKDSSGNVVPVPDQHTMQIGLAMIDQASTNALPTRVEFGANAGTNPLNGSDQALYGNKNLPYLYKMVIAYYRPTTLPPDSVGVKQAYFSAWAEPLFWSPYLSVVTNTAPLQVQIRADSTNAASGFNQFYAGTTTSSTAALSMCTPALPCGGPGSSTDIGGTSGATIGLSAANAATLQNATVNPVILSSLLTSGAIANPPPINDIRAEPAASGWTGTNIPPNADVFTENGNTFAGFWMGLAAASNPSASVPPAFFGIARFTHGQQSPTTSRSNHAFVLEANYGTTASPRFLEVQRMSYKYWAQYPVQVQEADCFTVQNRKLDFFTFNDPRTGRFSFDFMNPSDYDVHNGTNAVSATAINQLSWTTFPNSSNPFTGPPLTGPIKNIPTTSTTLTITPSQTPGISQTAWDTFRFADNTGDGSGNTTPHYQDTDGVQRPGDAWWSTTSANTMPTRVDSGTIQYRPIILNRPFLSVGELGYVYRDMPWRSLDVGTANSADAGLLDYFCINDGYGGSTNAPVIAGVFNLNTPHPEVLKAMVSGTARAELHSSWDISVADATSIANAITNVTWNSATPLPLLNKAEIATRLAPTDPTVNSPTVNSGTSDSHIKEEREAVVRALANAGQARTWNLMIDVVAQTGHLPPGASGFNNFLVTAEQRYWAHVAIDRYTGQVISMQLEPVSE